MPEHAQGGFGADLLFGLGAAFAWAAATAARLGAPLAGTLAAAFGCAAASVCPLVAIGRRAHLAESRLPRWLLAAALAAGPLTVAGNVLQAKTHHRPLGGVTFAFVGAAVFVAALRVCDRVLGEKEGAARARGARAALAVGSLASLLLLARAAGPLFGRGAPPEVRDAAADAALGVLFVALGVLAPAGTARPWTRWLGPLAWLGVSALGVGFLSGQPAIREGLAERAPMTLGIIGRFCGGTHSVPGAAPRSIGIVGGEVDDKGRGF